MVSAETYSTVRVSHGECSKGRAQDLPVCTPLLLRLSHGGRRAATENFGRFYKISAMRIVPARLHHQVVAVAGALFDKPAILHCAHLSSVRRELKL